MDKIPAPYSNFELILIDSRDDGRVDPFVGHRWLFRNRKLIGQKNTSAVVAVGINMLKTCLHKLSKQQRLPIPVIRIISHIPSPLLFSWTPIEGSVQTSARLS